MTFPPHTWIDPRVIVGKSSISGRGLFAAAPIAQGETIMIWGGMRISKAAYQAHEDNYRDQTLVPISDDEYLGLPSEDPTESIDEYLNHSCDPTAWLVDAVTVVARKDMRQGEEITVDCATWDADVSWEYADDGRCRCASPLCRGTLRPTDWTRPELQKRYAGHFSPYIQDKIDAAARTPNSTA